MLQNAGSDFILFLYALNFGTKLKCLIYFGDLFILTVENSRVPASWELTMHGFSLHSIRIQSLSLSVLLSRNMKQSLIETVDFRMISFNFDPMIEWRKKPKSHTHVCYFTLFFPCRPYVHSNVHEYRSLCQWHPKPAPATTSCTHKSEI